MICLCGLAHAVLFAAPFDDSYITYRYSENFAAGKGMVFNAGERVEGFTSFLWMVLLGGGAFVGLDLPILAPVLSLFASLALSVLTATLAHRYRGTNDSPLAVNWGPLIATAWLVCHGTWAFYALTGMETAFFALLITGTVACAARSSTRSAVAAGVLLLLATMCRPEGLGYWGLLVLALGLRSESRVRAVKMSAVTLAGYVPFFALRYSYFGEVFPNTYYAKASPSLGLLLRGITGAEEFFTIHLIWLVPLLWWRCFRATLATDTADLRAKEARQFYWVSAVLFLGTVANVCMVGEHTLLFYRFFLPVMPLMAVAVGNGLLHVFPARRWAGVTAGLVWSLGIATVSFLPRFSVFSRGDAPSSWEFSQTIRRFNDEYLLVGQWMKEHLPADTTLAMNAVGIVPYLTGFTTIDMVGLTDRHIAHRDITLGNAAYGHEKHDAVYVLERQPSLILPSLPRLTRRPNGTLETLGLLGRSVDAYPGDRELLELPRTPREYTAVSFPVNDGWLTVLARRDWLRANEHLLTAPDR